MNWLKHLAASVSASFFSPEDLVVLILKQDEEVKTQAWPQARKVELHPKWKISHSADLRLPMKNVLMNPTIQPPNGGLKQVFPMFQKQA